jgi:hypothetical protein
MCINRLRGSVSNAEVSNDCNAKSTYLRKRNGKSSRRELDWNETL